MYLTAEQLQIESELGPTIIVVERDNNRPDPWEGFVER
jgi:hypothetical protein